MYSSGLATHSMKLASRLRELSGACASLCAVFGCASSSRRVAPLHHKRSGSLDPTELHTPEFTHLYFW